MWTKNNTPGKKSGASISYEQKGESHPYTCTSVDQKVLARGSLHDSAKREEKLRSHPQSATCTWVSN